MLGGVFPSYASARSAAGARQYFCDGRATRKVVEDRQQVFLHRRSGLGGSSAKHRMCLIRYAPDLNIFRVSMMHAMKA
jgi:hypothetical protein